MCHPRPSGIHEKTGKEKKEEKNICWREGDHKTKSAPAPESRVATAQLIGGDGAAAEIAM